MLHYFRTHRTTLWSTLAVVGSGFLLSSHPGHASTKALSAAARAAKGCSISVKGDLAVLKLERELAQIRIVGEEPGKVVSGSRALWSRTGDTSVLDSVHPDEYVLLGAVRGETDAEMAGFGGSFVARLLGGGRETSLIQRTRLNRIALASAGKRITPATLTRTVDRYVNNPNSVRWQAVTPAKLRELLKDGESAAGVSYGEESVNAMVSAFEKFRGRDGKILIGKWGSPWWTEYYNIVDGRRVVHHKNEGMYVAAQQGKTRNLLVAEVRMNGPH